MSSARSAAAGDETPAEPNARVRALPHGEAVIELELPSSDRFHAVGRLVVGGLAARLGFDVDEMDDLRLAVDALLLHEPAEETLQLTITESADALDLRLGPFVSNGVGSAQLDPVLRALVHELLVEDSEQGRWIAVRVGRRSGVRGSR